MAAAIDDPALWDRCRTAIPAPRGIDVVADEHLALYRRESTRPARAVPRVPRLAPVRDEAR